jgi:hypothetical protein
MKPGTKVKMSEELKHGLIEMKCKAHVDEFGDCIGIVEDKAWIDDDAVNVRWQPSGLRYMYSPETLVIWN